MKGHTAAVIVAAGTGSRLGGDQPKAFVEIGEAPLFVHSLRCFDRDLHIDHIALVVSGSLCGRAQEIVNNHKPHTRVTIVAGGSHRWESARNGVIACEGAEWVLVHDAARPFVTGKVIACLLATRSKYKCCVTATPVVDTIRQCEGDRAVGVVDRSSLVRVGTPQLFFRESLIEAFSSAHEQGESITDEAVLMENQGFKVGIAPGDPANFKITTPEDLLIARAIFAAHSQTM